MAQPIARKLKKGELLFSEGDPSKAMYFVQAGTIRLFKKKGNASIELGMIHKGEVIGEMGFLDGGPRSASAEAMHDTELTEITNTNLAEQLKVLPPWLMVLLKTVVNRLRSANNKIRQLESATTAYTYGSEGVSTVYQFFTIHEILKMSTALLISAARNAEKDAEGWTKVSMNRINKYANQIMGIPTTKVVEFLDILEKVGLVKVNRAVMDKVEVAIGDLEQLDLLVSFVNEENMKDHAKKTNFSIKAVVVMGYIVKHLGLFPVAADGLAEVNLAKIIEVEKAASGKDPFRMDESIIELVKAKLATEVALKDSTNILTKVRPLEIARMYRIQKIIKEIDSTNDKKREQASRGNVAQR